MEELKEKILEAKSVKNEINELEDYYSKRHSQKALSRILELRDKYEELLSFIYLKVDNLG